MISKDDRIAFSLKIVSADSEIKALDQAKAQLQDQVDKIQKLDTANKNLFDPVNDLVNAYQAERALLSGQSRTTFDENSIQGAAKKQPKNAFFPNDLATTVPSLSGSNNVWTQVAPFALNTALGKTYSEAYPGTVAKESDLIQAVLTVIAGASSYMDIELTSGENCISGGTCSISSFTDQASCVAATPTPGVWTPNGTSVIAPYPDVIALKSSLISAVAALTAFLNTETASIVTNDSNAGNQAQNNAALAALGVFQAALATWNAYPDFQAVPGSVTTCSAFYAYDPNLLAPTKLHSAQLTALTSTLNARLSDVTSRVSQLDTVLGSISQNVSDGSATGSGLYFKRYNLVSLRLNALGGSLIQLTGMNLASNAQTSIKQNTINNKNTYLAVLPTSALKANANGTAMVNVLDPTQFQVGDTVWVYSETQDELVRAIKAIDGDRLTLNDQIPAKYAIADKARVYKEA